MKILLTLLLTSCVTCFSCGQAKENKKEALTSDSIIPPRPVGWVSDFEKIFTASQVAYLDSLIDVFEKETSHEIAIVSLRLDSVSISSAEDFNQLSLALFRKWGVGKKNKNNGLGILFSVALRKIRIETGYGLETKLTDKEAKTIIDTLIIPAFKEGDYFTGIKKGLEAIMTEIK